MKRVKMNGCQIAMSTCERPGEYLSATLRSLAQADASHLGCDLRLVVCGTNSLFIDRDVLPSGAVIELMGWDQWAVVRKLTPKHRSAMNFLRLVSGADEGEDLVALQDDIVFASGWLDKARALAEPLEREHRAGYVLALYSTAKFTRKPCAPYNCLRFFGNQALYLSAAAHRQLGPYLRGRIERGEWNTDDMMLKDWLIATRIPLYAANPSLVQHVGKKSALELRFHQSPTFRP